jgi:hypothetical protein
MGRGGGTVDGIWSGDSICWPLTGRTTSNYNTVAVSTIYSLLLHTPVFSVYSSLKNPFPGNGFNTGSVTGSSLYYSTSEVFSSQPNTFHHNWTANPQLTLSNNQFFEPAWVIRFIAPGRTQLKTPSVHNTSVLGIVAETCLPSCCLVMDVSCGSTMSYHSTNVWLVQNY